MRIRVLFKGYVQTSPEGDVATVYRTRGLDVPEWDALRSDGFVPFGIEIIPPAPPSAPAMRRGEP